MRTIGFGIFAMAACLSYPVSVRAKVFVYPEKSQSTEQQKRDSYECYEWAKTQSGVDPSAAPGAVEREAGAARPDRRAEAAKGHGRPRGEAAGSGRRI